MRGNCLRGRADAIAGTGDSDVPTYNPLVFRSVLKLICKTVCKEFVDNSNHCWPSIVYDRKIILTGGIHNKAIFRVNSY